MKSRTADKRGGVADHVVGRLANTLLAPVPPIQLVDVPQELIANQAEMAHFPNGLAHGSRWVNGCSPRGGVSPLLAQAVNRDRSAALAVFYGLGAGDDFQLFYENVTSVVWSFDHGRFLPGSDNWSPATLDSAPAGAPNTSIMTAAGITTADLGSALAKLSTITNDQIADAVVSVPDDWPITDGDRLALVKFFARRRRDLVGP